MAHRKRVRIVMGASDTASETTADVPVPRGRMLSVVLERACVTGAEVSGSERDVTAGGVPSTPASDFAGGGRSGGLLG